MAVDFVQIRNIERRRYVLEYTPSILCALISRRASTDPVNLILLAVRTAEDLFDTIEPRHAVSTSTVAASTVAHPNGNA